MQREATQLAGDAADDDPAVGLAAVAALRSLLDTLERLQVGAGTRAGLAVGAHRRGARRQQAGRPQEARRMVAEWRGGGRDAPRLAAPASNARRPRPLRRVVAELFAAAQVEAIAFRHDFIGTEHVLLALLKRDDEVGRALRQLGLDTRGRAVRRPAPRRRRPGAGDGVRRRCARPRRSRSRCGARSASRRRSARARWSAPAARSGRCGGGTAFGVSPRLKRALESARCDAAEVTRK